MSDPAYADLVELLTEHGDSVMGAEQSAAAIIRSIRNRYADELITAIQAVRPGFLEEGTRRGMGVAIQVIKQTKTEGI